MNADPDEYRYSDYGIEYDASSDFYWSDGSSGKNVIIFSADMSSSMHIDNWNKNILVFGEGLTKGLNNTTVTAEAKYYITFTQSIKKHLC